MKVFVVKLKFAKTDSDAKAQHPTAKKLPLPKPVTQPAPENDSGWEEF
ncbi:MAG: hypothetical protein R3E08_13490 [Thiotrichaceae bacterium]